MCVYGEAVFSGPLTKEKSGKDKHKRVGVYSVVGKALGRH